MDAADFDPNEVDEDGLPLVGAAVGGCCRWWVLSSHLLCARPNAWPLGPSRSNRGGLPQLLAAPAATSQCTHAQALGLC